MANMQNAAGRDHAGIRLVGGGTRSGSGTGSMLITNLSKTEEQVLSLAETYVWFTCRFRPAPGFRCSEVCLRHP